MRLIRRIGLGMLFAGLWSLAVPPDGISQVPKSTVNPFALRVGEQKKKILESGGPSAETEVAVRKGLAWLAKQQKADGSWEFDGTSKTNRAAATGLAVLAYLGAGETPDSKTHGKTVDAGLRYLISKQDNTGSLDKSIMYGHAICTLAVVEAFGMTRQARFQTPAQAAVNHIVRAQGANGSWGYAPNTNGDTSITGWTVQALAAAKQARLTVPNTTFTKAEAFLKTVADKDEARYGYSSNAPTPSTTAIGLLTRAKIGWSLKAEGWTKGQEYVESIQPMYNLYTLFYSTQVLLQNPSDGWKEKWNPALHKTVLGKQDATDGSFAPDIGFIGPSCGKIGSTAFALLVLENYYRYPPAPEAAVKK